MNAAKRFVMSATMTSCLAVPLALRGAEIDATPVDYRDKIAVLEPGDTLRLASGTYNRLTLSDLNGTPDNWITIAGPESGDALITGESCCNTVQIRRCSYLAVKNLTIDSLGLAGIDGINVKDGQSHNLVIEGNTIRGVGASQQTVGINTKSTVWNVTVRSNRIEEPGTGMYFGNSDGNSPFVAGLIEGNLVLYPTGYAIQIKHQNPYNIAALPDEPRRTIIRHNTLAKDGRSSPDGDRPSLLVGHFPNSGQGSLDRYAIYGNFIYKNPRESLIQASGRSEIHDNLLVTDEGGTSVYLSDHEGTLEIAHVYHNTILGGSRGVRFASPARTDHSVVANAIFATTPISGSCSNSSDNIVDSSTNAGNYIANPSAIIGELNLYPKPGALRSAPVQLPADYMDHPDANSDFNSTPKGLLEYRGAYAGEGTNPGWQPRLERKLLDASAGNVPSPPVIVDP